MRCLIAQDKLLKCRMKLDYESESLTGDYLTLTFYRLIYTVLFYSYVYVVCLHVDT